MVYPQLKQSGFGSWPRLLLPAAILLLVGLLWLAYARPFQDAPPTFSTLDAARSTLSFIPNAGQSDSAVRYLAHPPGMTLFFTDDSLTFSGAAGEEETAAPLQWRFLGAETAEIQGRDTLPGVVNYLYGPDPEEWQTGLPTFGTVRYEGLYPGVDAAFGGVPGQIAAAFELEAGVEPGLLQWRFTGATPQLNGETGGLVLVDEDGRTIMEFEPPLVQQAGEPAAATFTVNELSVVTAKIAGYDPAQSLTIFLAARPSELLLSGFGGVDRAYGVASNPAMETFVIGATNSSEFPTVAPFQADNAGDSDIFITKFSAAGQVVFSTYLGGTASDFGEGVAVDSAGDIILTGFTASTDFPLSNAIMTDQPEEDVFVSKLSADGSQLLFSTYLGGGANDRDSQVALNDQDDIYVFGRTFSADYPLLNPIQNLYGGGDGDTFLSKISGDLNQLVFSTYLGGDGLEISGGIDLDQNGDFFVTGATNSADFPVVNSGVPQPPVGQGFINVFITKVTADGSSLLFSALFGGAKSERGNAVSIDPLGNPLVVGQTDSIDFPVVAPIQPMNNGDYDAFITRIAGDGSSLLMSTYLGGHGVDVGLGIVVGGAGNVFVTGRTESNDFPQLNPLPGMGYPGGGDAFVALQSGMGNLVWSTYLGGGDTEFGNDIDVDGIGRPVVAGWTNSSDFPTANAFQSYLNIPSDGFVSRLNHGGTVLEFSTYLGGGNGYLPTDVTVSGFGETAEPTLNLYILGLGLLILLVVGVWVVNRSKTGEPG